MPKRRLFFILLALFLLAGALFFYFRYQNGKHSNHITLYGNVDVRQVDLGFRVYGRVTSMPFEEGDLVPAGTLMGTLDKQPYLDEVKQQKALVEALQRSLANSELIMQRRREIVGAGAVSDEDYQNALASRDVTLAQLKAQKAAYRVAKKNLKDTEVYCPNTGTILTRIREPGAVVNIGEPIYTLSILSPVWIRAFVPEPLLGTIYPGMKAEIYTDTKNGTVYTGQIGFISPVAEFTPKTVETTELRTDLVYRIRIYADNPDKFLKQGMPVTVKLCLKPNNEPKESAASECP